jgi:UDP-glucose 4-epimerase
MGTIASKNVLVLGGLGFVGRHVCQQFSQQGFIVYGIGHGHISSENQSLWGINQWIESEITESILLEKFGDKSFCAVIHCAGSGAVSLSYSNPADDYHRSTTSVIAGLEFVRVSQSKNTRFVLASSAAVYGNQEVILTESSPIQPISPYGIHKRVAEMVCEEYASFFSVKCSVVRLFSVYGNTLKKQLLWDACNKIKNGTPEFFGTGDEMRDWIHVTDSADLLFLSALNQEQCQFEIYNGGSAHASTHEVLQSLSVLMKSEKKLTFNGTAHTGNPISLLTSIEKAKIKLGWLPKVLMQDGLYEYVNWYYKSSVSEY